ncbi:MAG: diguanylate cyclase [Deltaproteobacteria bacterium]|nr:diguanylate cyclase [Candidatus Anaeroferrophillus wilburensis]MBN2889638.1 diguanylate cyclase [Deltaproteobacteria bacterium]
MAESRETDFLLQRFQELQCLYGIHLLIGSSESSLETVIQQAAAIIPSAWDSQTIAGCRVHLASHDCMVLHGEPTPHKESCTFPDAHTTKGIVEVYYAEEKGGNGRTSLLPEIAGHLARMIDQKQLNQTIKQINDELVETNQQLEAAIEHANMMAIEAEITNIELTQIFNTSADSMWVVGTDFKILRVNNKLQQLIGLQEQEIVGRHCDSLLSHSICRGDECPLQRIKKGAKAIEYDLEAFAKPEAVPCIMTATPLKGLDQELIGIVVGFKDITDRKKAEKDLQQANEKLQQLVTIDGLTKIANRRRFDEYLLHEWQRLKRDRLPLSLIMVDIDFFKLYNDTYGHQAGDECLQTVAKVIEQQAKRPADLAARYGGEEFAIILPNTDAKGACQLAEQILQAVENLQLTHYGSPVNSHVTISLGISTAVPHADYTPTQLVACADHGLYKAKEGGRNRIAFQEFDRSCTHKLP